MGILIMFISFVMGSAILCSIIDSMIRTIFDKGGSRNVPRNRKS